MQVMREDPRARARGQSASESGATWANLVDSDRAGCGDHSRSWRKRSCSLVEQRRGCDRAHQRDPQSGFQKLAGANALPAITDSVKIFNKEVADHTREVEGRRKPRSRRGPTRWSGSTPSAETMRAHSARSTAVLDQKRSDHYLAAGVSQKTLADAYELTATQVSSDRGGAQTGNRGDQIPG